MLIYSLDGLKLRVEVKALMMSHPIALLNCIIPPLPDKCSSITPQDVFLFLWILKKEPNLKEFLNLFNFQLKFL